MSKNFKYALVISLLFLLFFVLIFRINIYNTYNDLIENSFHENAILWTKDDKLTSTDFEFETNYGTNYMTAYVAFSIRWNEENPIMFDSKTYFHPEKSIISDTTNHLQLQKAQLKFDLLEVHRRKMNRAVDSLSKLKMLNIEPSYIEDIINDYYSGFNDEWEQYIELNESDSLSSIGKLIERRLD